MYRTYILLVSHLICVQSYADYYWRDYDGSIPPDAIPADDNNVSYIGQVYVDNRGYRAVSIVRGSNLTEVNEVFRIDIMIRIMCARNHSNFIWVKTTGDTFKKDLEGQVRIVAGYLPSPRRAPGTTGLRNIGRTRYDGRTFIGNIVAYHNKTAWLSYFLYGTRILLPENSEYEVLVYRHTPPTKNLTVGNERWTIL